MDDQKIKINVGIAFLENRNRVCFFVKECDMNAKSICFFVALIALRE
jgi:hypothetical protein